MKVGDLVKHTPTGNFVVILELQHEINARICFTTGRLVGFKGGYATCYLEAI